VVAREQVGGLRFHHLRHSYATWLVDDGVPPNMVQRVMGHERSSTTLDLYTRRTEDGDRILRALSATTRMTLTMTPARPRDAFCCLYRPDHDERPGPLAPIEPLTRPFACGRYWDRTSDLFGVNVDAASLLLTSSVVACLLTWSFVAACDGP
jgi:hypothetical protein